MKENRVRKWTYQIMVQGLLRENWENWLDGFLCKIDRQVTSTLITIQVPDQAALRGILNKLWDLNLILISVIRQDTEPIGEDHEN